MPLSTLFASTPARIAALLDELGVSGPTVFAGPPRWTRRLQRANREVIDAGDAAEHEPGEAGAVVIANAASRDDFETLALACVRIAADDAPVVLVDRADPTELSRRALCCGLTDLQQRTSARQVITWGRVRHL